MNGSGFAVRRVVYLGVAGLALMGGGCLAVAAGTAAVAGGAVGYCYLKGKVPQEFNASLDDTWTATRQALADLNMPVASTEREGDSGFIECRAEGDTVRITLSAQPGKQATDPTVTRVAVRVGTFGDQALSERVLAQVAAHLTPAQRNGIPAAALEPVPQFPPATTVTVRETPPPPLAPQPVWGAEKK
jgi:hypothetical protein